MFSDDLLIFLHTGVVPADPTALAFFRISFGASLLLKHLVERSRLYPSHVNFGTFTYDVYIRPRLLARLGTFVYVYSFRLRPLLLLTLISGFQVRPAATFLSLSYLAETYALFRYHVVIACLLVAILAADPAFVLSPALPTSFAVLPSASAPGVLFIKTLVPVVYASSAWRKLQLRFYDGAVLTYAAKFSTDGIDRKFPDHFHRTTTWILNSLFPRFSKQLGSMTIVLELLLPSLLFLGAPYTYIAILLGFALHLGITCLFPITFSFFTLMMWSTYILWL